VNYISVQKCLNIVVVVVNLCGSMATRLKTANSVRSPSFEELPRTLHHRARCGPLYRRVLVFYNASACFKTLNTSLSMYSYIIQELM
jgi:ABC-type arginine/histidine transport system permease subunit